MGGNPDGSRKTKKVVTVTLVDTGKLGKRGIGKEFPIYLDRGAIYLFLLVVYQKTNERFSWPKFVSRFSAEIPL